MDLNKVMLIGNLTRDPEMRTTPGGQNVCSFGLATNLVWNDQSGQRQTRAEFHNIVAWRKLAEICAQYLKKGNKIYIEGRMQTRDWQDKEGNKRQRTEIVADNMIMLDRGGSDSPFGAATPLSATSFSRPSETPSVESPKSEPSVPGEDQEIRVEDIPF